MEHDVKFPPYSVLIQWSDEDKRFLAPLPDWSKSLIGFAIHRSSYEEALAATQITIVRLVSIAIERGEPLSAFQSQPFAA